jgi:hypothetical protein
LYQVEVIQQANPCNADQNVQVAHEEIEEVITREEFHGVAFRNVLIGRATFVALQ